MNKPSSVKKSVSNEVKSVEIKEIVKDIDETIQLENKKKKETNVKETKAMQKKNRHTTSNFIISNYSELENDSGLPEKKKKNES